MLTVVFSPYDDDVSMDKVSQFVSCCADVKHLLDDTYCLVFPSVHACKLALHTHVVDFSETAVIKDQAHALLLRSGSVFENKNCFIISVVVPEKHEQPSVVAVTILSDQ